MSDKPRLCPFDGQPLHRTSVPAPSAINGIWPAEHATHRTSWTCRSGTCTYCEPDRVETLLQWGWLRVFYERLADRVGYQQSPGDARWILLVHAVRRLEPDREEALEPLRYDPATRAEILSWLEKLRREAV